MTLNINLFSQDLKLELKELEDWLTELNALKLDYERQINSFNSNYLLRFGGLIEEILKLRAHIYGKRKLPSDFIIIDLKLLEELRKKLFNSQKDLPQPLDDSEHQQLKTAYRKASRLCHPDKLAEDTKARGEEIFKALNEAYRNQDLDKVCSILLELEAEATSFVVASEHIDDRSTLRQKITLLYEQIAILEAEIKCLQENEVYQRIQSITDMDSYFSEIERELQGELKTLKDKEFIY